METSVKVKIYYYEVFEKGNLVLNFNDDITLNDVFKELDRLYGKKFLSIYGKSFLKAISGDFNIFLNNEHISIPLDLERNLRNGDTLMIVRPISGG